MGMLIVALIFGAISVAIATTRTIEITYGVNVVVDGMRQNFADDLRPFTSEGRTFLPVRGIADALGLDVEWDGTTSTVHLNNPTQAPVFRGEPQTINVLCARQFVSHRST